MAEKVTIMEIKVDLQCPRCYKKIKKVLCKFHQIRDQIYNEKNNTVTITVVCCSPEKIKQKICYKGGKTIKGIEIKEPPKPKPPEKPKEAEKPKEPEKKPEKPKEPEKAKEPEKPKPKPVEEKPPSDQVVIAIVDPPRAAPTESPPMQVAYPPAYPIGVVCCKECYEGHIGGPCFRGYEGYGRPVYDSLGGGGNRGYHPIRCDYYCEENPSACTIM